MTDGTDTLGGYEDQAPIDIDAEQTDLPQATVRSAGQNVVDFATGKALPKSPVWPNRKSNTNVPTPHPENVEYLLAKILGAVPYRDDFSRCYHISGFEEFDELTDECMRALYVAAMRYGLEIKKDRFADIVLDTARQRARHPVCEHLDALQWDGVRRVGNWLSIYLGAASNPYTRHIGALTLVGAVRRVKQPGCKFDAMLVLEGPQGNDKSSAIRALAGDAWYTDSVELGLSQKEMIEQTRGSWIVEISELGGRKRSEINLIKAQLSRQTDRGRMAYDKSTSNEPRQFILIGSTNEGAGDGYLLDTTGNRRFWPFKTGQIDLAALRRDRDQLWAEAAHFERTIRGDLVLPRALWPVAAAEQEARRAKDPLEDRLTEAVDGVAGFVSNETLYEVLGVGAGHDGSGVSKRAQKHKALISRVMEKEGWEPDRQQFTRKNKEVDRPRGFAKGNRDDELVWIGNQLRSAQKGQGAGTPSKSPGSQPRLTRAAGGAP